MSKLNRRTMLRGMLGGAAVGVGLPFLDCFLNINGTALADGPIQAGTRLPLRFGTWIWGCGHIPERWIPTFPECVLPPDQERAFRTTRTGAIIGPLLAKRFGKIVICGATSGYNLNFDVRYLWMRQKQILGSHFANAYQAERANQLVAEGRIRPVVDQVLDFHETPAAHALMAANRHRGKMVVNVQAPMTAALEEPFGAAAP